MAALKKTVVNPATTVAIGIPGDMLTMYRVPKMCVSMGGATGLASGGYGRPKETHAQTNMTHTPYVLAQSDTTANVLYKLLLTEATTQEWHLLENTCSG